MILYLKYDPQAVMELFIKDLVGSLGIPCNKVSAFEIQLDPTADREQIKIVSNYLSNFEIGINNDYKEQLVNQVKSLILQMINEHSTKNIKEYLCDKLPYTYRHISEIFQKSCHCSIENFVIFQKVEMIKKLAIQENLTLTEIAFKMNYCSVAHVSRQFKKTTGLTFQEFQKIIAARNGKIGLQPSVKRHYYESK